MTLEGWNLDRTHTHREHVNSAQIGLWTPGDSNLLAVTALTTAPLQELIIYKNKGMKHI